MGAGAVAGARTGDPGVRPICIERLRGAGERHHLSQVHRRAPGPAPRVHVDGIAGIARTEIEVGLVCPPALVGSNSPLCAEHTLYKIRFHWVCPGQENVNSNICKESNFEFFISMNGKVAFSADGDPINSNSPNTTVPPCPRGYLIGWVENTNDQPIKFDGLIGNAVIRGPDIVSAGNNSTAVSAYNAIPIQ